MVEISEFVKNNERAQVLMLMAGLKDPKLGDKFEAWQRDRAGTATEDTHLIAFYKFLIDRAIAIFSKLGLPTSLLCDIKVEPVIRDGGYVGQARLIHPAPAVLKRYTDGLASNTCVWIGQKVEKGEIR